MILDGERSRPQPELDGEPSTREGSPEKASDRASDCLTKPCLIDLLSQRNSFDT